MADILLPWEIISWSHFQRLTIHIAHNRFPKYFFEEYLKQGNDQEGIDIINSNVDSEGKYITLQCKHIAKITKSGLEKIIYDFKQGKFYEKSSHFILATTADLQKKDVQAAIIEHREAFRAEKIAFECWDRNLLSEQLKSYFRLVYLFFGKEYADKHCFLQRNDFPWEKNSAQEDYIPRSVGLYEAEKDYNSFTEWYYNTKKADSLLSIFKENPLLPKQMCLVGDAHLGKSTLLRQLAFELENVDMPYKCCFIELKLYNSQPIERILDIQFRGWKEIKAVDLVIIIDGLDEVESSNFIASAKYINEFRLENQIINIIFSCRKLFYKHYKLDSIVSKFIPYEVLPLGYSDIDNYLTRKLGSNKAKFEQKVSISGISRMMYHPFYLTKLVEKYIQNPRQLPANKAQLIDLFVEESLVVSNTRNVYGGSLLSQVMVDFKKIIQEFAFALQLLGSNALDDSDIQKLFKRQEVELLQLSSLVVFYNGKWSFINAIFQEHLAAFVLSKMDFEAIVDTISIGTKLRKIKAKWLQTTASLMTFLEGNNEKYKKLLKFIVSDNIEIIFTTEGSKFNDSQKLEFLHLLLERCNGYSMRPMLIDYRTIAAFIGNSTSAKDYLISVIGRKSVLMRVKSTFISVLTSIELSDLQRQQLYKSAKRALKDETDTYFIRETLEMLVTHKLGDSRFVTSLTKNNSLNSIHEYRDGIYQLIQSLGLIEDFYNYALDGMQYLLAKNRGVTYGGSEISIEEILFNTHSYNNILKLFIKMNDDEWLEYYQYSYRKSNFLKKLAIACANIYSTNPLILLHVVRFIKSLGKRHFNHEYQELHQFFKLTKTNLTAFQMLNSVFEDDSYWQFGYIISTECIEHIMYLYEEGMISDKHIRIVAAALDYAKKSGLRDELFQLYMDINELGEWNAVREPTEYEKQEQIRLENDIRYIQSKSAFKKGVIRYFKAYGKESIPENDIYIDPEVNPRRVHADSYFVFIFISHWAGAAKKRVYKKTCLNILDKPNSFDWFRAEQIINSHYNKQESFKSVTTSILEEYFNKNIDKCDFENCIWDIEEDGETHKIRYRRLEVQMGHIFRDFGFEIDSETLMNLVWLDDGGIRTLNDTSNNSYNTDEKRKSIAELILDGLSKQEMALFKEKILSNLKKGIKSRAVLGTHFSLCRYLMIYEAIPLILNLINDSKTIDYSCYNYINIYIELGGDEDDLIPILKSATSYNGHTYLLLIELLHKSHPEIVRKSLNKCIAHSGANEEVKITAAKYLCKLGDNSGFDYLIKVLHTTQKAPYNTNGSINIGNIDTAYALKKLERHIYLLLVPRSNSDHFHESPREIILEWLYSLAKKSESDTELVYKYLLSFQKKLATKYESHYDLFWYAFRVIENFREHHGSNMTIDEVKACM